MRIEDWNSLTKSLRQLHRALVQSARREYVRTHQLPGELGPGELLMLLTTDGSFAWLRSLSELMAEIDELADEPSSLDNGEVCAAVRGAVEALIAPVAEAAPGSFAELYWQYLHEDPDVAMAHVAVKQLIRTWPAAEQQPATLRTLLPPKRGPRN
jgi:hypothetical protein